MRISRWGAALAATTILIGCSESTAPTTVTADESDYALYTFGTDGAALEGTLGNQGPRPFDGRTGGFGRLPGELQLTEEQRAEIAGLREAFRTAHQSELDALKAIFDQARAARESGATREEIRAILETGKPIADALRPAVRQLHEDILNVLTEEQRAWIRAHRPHVPGFPGRGGGGGPPRP
jgi:Spy/CpxP family protein refolding chaperone